jgi:hypothetical protein
MEADKKFLSRLLDMPVKKVEIDRYSYTPTFPDEVKAWKYVGKNDRALRRYQKRLYYPPTALLGLLDLVTELLYRLRFAGQGTIPALISSDARFHEPVTSENELLIHVKLLRSYKGKMGIFSGVILNQDGDIVAENISKGIMIHI